MNLGRIAGKNGLVAIAALLPLLVVDYLYVRSGQNRASIWASEWFAVPALSIAVLGFFWANWGFLGASPKLVRVAAVTALSLVATALWFVVVAWAVVSTFHLAIGGRL